MRGPLGVGLLCALSALGPVAVAAQQGSPAGPVPPELLAERRARLLAALDGQLAVIGSDRLRNIEVDYPQDSDFRQAPNFFYLTGLEEPDGWLVLNGGRPGSQTLYLPPRDTANETWTGRRIGPGVEARGLSGIQEVRTSDRFPTDVRRWTARLRSVVVSPGDDRNWTAVHRSLSGPQVEMIEGGPLMARLRLVKDADELARLRRAIDITAEGQREAWRVTEPGRYESEVEAALEYVFRVQGAERVGFPSIVGSGPNSTTLHYDKNRRLMEAGDLLVADIGAEFGYYTADITRTIPVSGTFTPRQRAVYELVLGAQEAGLSEIRPGNTLRHAHQAAVRYLDEHSGDVCGERSCSQYFLHGLSHWLGMDVHDVGETSTPFEPGMVLTVEPGIYLAEEAIGIRIEDDVLVTTTGYELLTAALPRSPAEIEAAMREEPRWIQRR